MNVSNENQRINAVAYVRMSTEHQKYSTDNQLDVIKAYAAKHGFELIDTYSDSGKSGLRIQGRDALSRMIVDVQKSTKKFSVILVYDVSRWGRFQDADESAHYEYLCKLNGVTFHYCAEQFENDGSPLSTIVKGVKRAMAGEYSRELSTKVFQGACRLIQLGFKQGGVAGFGLRRMLVDHQGNQKGTLKSGEHKSIQTDRVVLVPGPPDEVAMVLQIYSWFAHEQKTETEIALLLNERGILNMFGRPWTRAVVHGILTNEKYIGNNVYHRTSFKLKMKHVRNPENQWVRRNEAFPGIVPFDLFEQAKRLTLERSKKWSDEEMVEKLKILFQAHGKISGFLIDEQESFPSSTAYQHRFGSLVAVYKLIGYAPKTDYSFIEVNRRLRTKHPEIISQVIAQLEQQGATAFLDPETHLLTVNDEILVSIVLCRHAQTIRGASRWLVRLEASLRPDITIAVRMDSSNEGIRDYYLLPGADLGWDDVRMADYNGVYLDTYRFETLDYFFQLARRTQLKEVA